jgi:uncharacterized protein YjiK
MQNLKYILCHWLTITVLCSSIVLLLSHTHTEAKIKNVPKWDMNSHYDVGKPVKISGIEDNLSGLTYHPESDHLFAVVNHPTQLIELTKQGDIVRRIHLDGFVDTESVDYLGKNTFVVSEERRQQLVFFSINDATTKVRYDKSERLPMNWAEHSNRGMEGVAWSAQYGFFVLQEEPPKILNHVLHHTETSIDVEKLNHSLPNHVDDLAGISLFYSEQQPFLLVLSEASNALHMINLSGDKVASLSLKTGPFNFWPIMKQPEGVAVDNYGHIYIVGEPNQMLKLTRKTTLKQSF